VVDTELRATETAARMLGINLAYVAFSQSPVGAPGARQGARDWLLRREYVGVQ